MGILPTIRVIGPKGLAIINVSDLEVHRTKGFKTEAEVLAAEAKAKAEPGTGKLEDGTIEDLRRLAKERKIDLGKLTKKPDIIAKIRAESKPAN